MARSRPISIDLSDDSHIAFQQAVRFVFDNTEKSTEEILQKAGIAYAVGGRKVTPKARKNQKRVVKLVRRRRGAPSVYKALVLRQHKPDEWVEFEAKGGVRMARKEPIASVPNIGAAVGSWNGMMRALGSSRLSGLRKTGRVSDARYLSKVALQLTNRLSYIFKVTKNLTGVARMKAAQQMVKSTEATMRRSEKAFNR